MLLNAMTIYSQDKKTNEYRELIDSAISIFIEHTYENINDNTSKEDLIIYVVDENSKVINLDNVKSKLILKTIDVKDRKNRKSLKKGLKISQVIPTLDGAVFKVTIINFLVNYKGKRYYYVNSGGGNRIFSILLWRRKMDFNQSWTQ